MRFTNGCNCLVQTARREMTHQIPSYLDEYRVRLILGDNVPFQLEPKFAAMVVMKIFLGLEVPEQLRIETAAETNDPKMNLEKQGEKSGSNKGKGKQMGKILEEEQGDKSERVDIKDEEKEGEESK
ncbi:hypothetical protein F5Y10DRAFT_263840 [Nemania abortiva]|nr:hypothetical protein F5Y10DRAFT_263840 [Nemania abortiva]